MACSSVLIRRVRREDAPDLQTYCFSRNQLDDVQQQIERSLAGMAENRWLHLVAEVDGIVVGSAELKHETHRLLSHRAEWTGVVVCSLYRGRGIARALLTKTLAQAALWSIEIVTVGVRGGTLAEEVYRRLGFREYARLPGGFKEVRDGEVLIFDEVGLYLLVHAATEPT